MVQSVRSISVHLGLESSVICTHLQKKNYESNSGGFKNILPLNDITSLWGKIGPGRASAKVTNAPVHGGLTEIANSHPGIPHSFNRLGTGAVLKSRNS